MGTMSSARRRLEGLNPLAVDTGLAIALFAVTMIELVSSRGCGCVSTADAWWTAVFMATQTLPLALRRRYPFGVMSVIGVSAIVYDVLQIPPDPYTAVFALMLAVYTVSAYARRRLSIAAAVVIAIALVVTSLPNVAGQQEFGDIVNSVALLGGAWVVGENTRFRRRETELLAERAERAEREREERERIAALEERGRLAREIHDVIAHSVSVIAVQAGAARSIAEQRPDRAREALASIEEVSKQTMVELRRALGALRDPGDEAALRPSPGLDLVDELVEKVRRAGVSVAITREGAARAVPSGIDLSAYRIVQEALTNTVKHAGPTSARVCLRYGEDWLEVAVTDDGPGTPRPPGPNGDAPGTGHGLAGMRERVAMFGGTFEAGAVGAGFSVRASFPLPEPAP
jgi:signal transduction histidine kinase